jgi:hypothetical protein
VRQTPSPKHHTSDFARRAALLQADESGKLQPVAFWLKKFIGAELNHDVYRKELIAIAGGLKE